MHWFREASSKGELRDLFSKVLTILVDGRFDQAGIKAQNALKNTIAVSNAGLIRRTPVELSEIPLLEVPPLKTDHSGNKMTTSE